MDEGTSQYYFTASMDSGKTLCSLLKAIQFQEVILFDLYILDCNLSLYLCHKYLKNNIYHHCSSTKLSL